MEFVDHAAIVLSALLFLHYGFRCLVSGGMVSEFERFGLSRYRRLTGVLEMLGAVALLGGYLFFPLRVVGSGGLALLMLLGVAVRIRVRDRLVEMLPAIVLLVVNVWILVRALGR
jgi:hypothetical protein